MDELLEFCARMLGDRDAAAQAAERARRSGGDRARALAAAVTACREAGGDRGPVGDTEAEGEAHGEAGLPGAVAGELAAASARLPQRQREAIALRERFGLTHEQVGAAIGIEPMAVAPLLARARLRLRLELRGTDAPAGDCRERDRALKTIALRQDGEPVSAADEDWLIEHLGHCAGCGRAHAAMLEAAVCYRAWRLPAGRPGADADADEPAAVPPAR